MFAFALSFFPDATQSVLHLVLDSVVVQCVSNEILNQLRVIWPDSLVDHVAVQGDVDVFVLKVFLDFLPKLVLDLLVGVFVDYALYAILKLFPMTVAVPLADPGPVYGCVDSSVLNLHLEKFRGFVGVVSYVYDAFVLDCFLQSPTTVLRSRARYAAVWDVFDVF